MRNPAMWITFASIIGPLLLGASLFVPVAAAVAGIGFQFSHMAENAPGVAPGLWIGLAVAAVSAFFIYPAHFDSIEKCEQLAATASLSEFREALGITAPDDSRMRMLEAGCNSLPFYTMPSF